MTLRQTIVYYWSLPGYRITVVVGLLLVALALGGCSGPGAQVAQPLPTLSPVEAGDMDIVTGQLVFVPAYSEVFHGDREDVLQMGLTLAIHNTDGDNPIIIQSVRYYNTDGDLIREFIDQPVQLNPMATAAFVIDASDTSGGYGANFLVEWGAEQPVYEPVIEALMVNTTMATGVSFLSPGRVLRETRP